jgi:glycosyltransferase involved in cell wall biosynthesis
VEQTTFAWNLIRALRRDKIDILHVKDPQVALLIQRASALGLVPCRMILSHGTDESLDFLRKIDYLHHLAPWHLQDARAKGVWKPEWTAIPNFIDTEIFLPGRSEDIRKELNIPQDALVVLTAAAIKRNHKRIDYLLDEFGQLIHTRPDLPAWLVVAGAREEDTDELMERGRQLLGNRVRFLVNHPLDQMPKLYRLADLFILCTLKEMLGTVLLEAMASEVGCLVHQFPVTEWVVGPGGKTIDMERSGNLAEAFQTLLSDRQLLKTLGTEARQHCVEKFSRDVVIDQYLDYYRFVLAQGKPQGRRSAPKWEEAAAL